VEIGERFAAQKGIKQGDWVKISFNRGYIKAKAVVTKRIRTLKVNGQDVDTIGIPIHWGFTGIAKKGYTANNLTPSVGDANSQTPEYKAFLVNVEKVSRRRIMAMQSKDIIRRSATNSLTPAPCARDHHEEVAKLIDVTTCIGFKAYQVTCSEWNDIRDDVGINHSVYDNPMDLSAKSWMVMRFSEVEEMAS